ncbi:MAG: hypothetical protein KJ731_08865 [Alphaproteobacteria bacterium]|nr:hypothetical protein [Alphaproteobacteria bacterium]MBU1278995.1 hypothetical protein [Alphaproteobacteria bacterium]MBU1573060.1 hypothetical protein [Alphaproteobacteria bacterium]MBU1828573.1 hypothetical protein [Alphaproteobacteria bacterium]MBU2080048.1 hypothetical protein [Alphaproteobacteria bacterium]
MIGYVLTLGGDHWFGLRVILRSKLSEQERAALAYQALTSLDPENADAVVQAALQPMGTPLPPFLGGMAEARLWAASATRSELKAVALSAVEAMSAKDQMAFRNHISEVEIAI